MGSGFELVLNMPSVQKIYIYICLVILVMDIIKSAGILDQFYLPCLSLKLDLAQIDSAGWS